MHIPMKKEIVARLGKAPETERLKYGIITIIIW